MKGKMGFLSVLISTRNFITFRTIFDFLYGKRSPDRRIYDICHSRDVLFNACTVYRVVYYLTQGRKDNRERIFEKNDTYARTVSGSSDYRTILCASPCVCGILWYMMPLGFIMMLPFVGMAEETGWRGFLQPELEKKFPFPVATSITAVIWCVWHFPDWLLPTSNHYGDSLIGFSVTIFVWAFAAAAIYKAIKSTLACAVYHAFVNSIGAIYDWNALFDAYPKTNGMLLYFSIVFAIAVVVWIAANKRGEVIV